MITYAYDGEITINGYSIGKKYYETQVEETYEHPKEKAKANIIWQVRTEYEITHQLWKKVDLLDEVYVKPLVRRNVTVPGDEKINGGKQIGFDIPYPPDSKW